MSQNPIQQSHLDSEPLRSYIVDLIEAGETNATIVRRVRDRCGYATTKDSIRRFRKRHSLQVPGAEKTYTRIRGDSAEALTSPEIRARSIDDPKPVLDDPDKMLEDRGLDPEQWYVDSITVNEWEGPHQDGNIVTFYQAKFTAKRKHPELILQPVRSDGWRPPSPRRTVKTKSELVVIFGDHQAPFHDKDLHEVFRHFLAEQKPQRVVHLGDLVDFPDISRHPLDPENVAKANECLQAGYDILRDCVQASPNTEWDYIPGNHDERIRQYLLKFAPNLYGLRRVDTPDELGDVVSGLPHLLRLDELGINFVEPEGTYENAQVELSAKLAVRHGWIVRQGSGVSALKTLERTGYSIITGHTHRQSIVHHTIYEIDRTPRILLAAEAGCMCRIDSQADDETGRRFPSYDVFADWQPGFCTATIYPDGKFKVDLGTWVNGVLLWQGQRYE